MVFSIMARVHASTTADEEFEPQSGQAKDYKIDICRFSSKHEALYNLSVVKCLVVVNNISAVMARTSYF
jgi:hypothetical protein